MITSPGPVIIDVGALLSGGAFSMPLRWYGLLSVFSMFILYKVIQSLLRSRKSQSLGSNNLFEWVLVSFIGGVVGARAWYVLLNFSRFAAEPWSALAIWQGGQSIQGGFAGGLIAAAIYHRFHYKNLPSLSDTLSCASVGLPLAQAIGRWGNFFNIEAFGPASNLPWCLYVPPHLRPKGLESEACFHPTFLYESLYLLACAAIMYYAYKTLALNGKAAMCIYLIIYSVGRIFLEGLRKDSLLLLGMPAARVLAVFTICACFMAIFLFNRYNTTK